MKRLILVVVLLVYTLTFSGCTFLDNTPFQVLGNRINAIIANPLNDPAKEHPERNLQEFLVHLQKQDFVGSTEYISDQVKQSYNEEYLKLVIVGEGFNLTKVKFATDKMKQIDVNKANVYYNYNKEPLGSLGQEAVMVKEGGNWKVLSFGEFDDY